MNLLGPLANPAGARRQVIGAADPGRAALLANALLRLGVEHALVAHGEVGMDELSPVGRSLVWEVRPEGIATWTLDPAEFGLDWDDPGDLAGGEPDRNAARLEQLLAGDHADPAGRRAVLLNAAAAIYVAGLAEDFGGAVEAAAAALDRGAAARVLERLRREAPPGMG
jgi:anthranilate phosphoribosyltransferase